MKILSIGDIHGRDTWKFLTHGSPYEYNLWRTSVDAGAPADDYEFWKSEHAYANYDLIIFVGDYVDSFTVWNVIMKQNLEDIIHFKKALGDKVVLLLGNHDIQYIVPNQICSGYRPEMRYDFGQIFSQNLELFKIAHEIHSGEQRWLWTHAGVTSGWYDKALVKNLMNPAFRHADLVRDFDPGGKRVSEVINFAWELRMNTLFNVDIHSGGMDSWAGPLWVRPNIMNYWPLMVDENRGYNQVMGHTPQGDIWVVESDPDGINFPDFKHYFIDCLEHGSEMGLVLEIE